jgi:hypothetical protein
MGLLRSLDGVRHDVLCRRRLRGSWARRLRTPTSDEAFAGSTAPPPIATATTCARGLGGANTSSSKVVGLGAPTSVRMVLELSEVPSLLDAIGDELARHGCGSHIKGREFERETDVDPADRRYHAGELQRMLGDIERASESRYAFDHIRVLWPTVMAHGVVHGAATAEGHALCAHARAHARRPMDDGRRARPRDARKRLPRAETRRRRDALEPEPPAAPEATE